jgi:twinkle protein
MSVKHTSCDNCGSSDANALYEDGHAYCFACQTYTPSADAEYEAPEPRRKKEPVNTALTPKGTVKAIPHRGISTQTCEKYDVTQTKGETGDVHYYPYFDEHGTLVAYKVKKEQTKEFFFEGNTKAAGLFGQHLFAKGGKYVTVVEGEADALAAFQMTGSQWPVVSIKNGAQAALKDCKQAYEWLDSFESVVICFDADEPGRKAAKEVAELFGPKAKVFKHEKGFKDACDYLREGQGKLYVDRWWKAETYVPDGIIQAADLWEAVSTPEQPAKALYPWKGLNNLLYGMREAELITITAGSGLGKSQFLREILYHILKTTDMNIGAMFMEESVKKTARSIMSIHANKKLHLPDTPVSESELRDAFTATLGSGRIYLFDHFGSTSGDNILSRIRYMAKALDCKVIFLDHLSIIVSGQELTDERKAIDNLMTKLRTLVQELNITLFCVSHLRRASGDRGHEDGSSVSLSQLRGSGAIAQLSDAVITLERNSMADDAEERHTTKIAVAKNRFNGDTGPACMLKYDTMTGRMHEVVEDTL